MANLFSGIVDKETLRREKGDALIPIAYKYAEKMASVSGGEAINYYKLLMETANQESHFGNLSSNIMRIDPIQVKELSDPKHKKLRESLGLTKFDVNDPDSAMGLAAATYLSRMKGHDVSTQQARAKVWKDLYNTTAGKGTPEKFLETNGIMNWEATDMWSTLQSNKQLNFVDRLYNKNKYPKINNADGTYSTHKMSSANVGGKAIAFPTIVYDNESKSLKELDIKQAIDYAIKNKEYIEFKSDAEADFFADNGYKLAFPRGYF
jgi:hypothetical protein